MVLNNLDMNDPEDGEYDEEMQMAIALSQSAAMAKGMEDDNYVNDTQGKESKDKGKGKGKGKVSETQQGEYYELKKIDFLGRQVPIILQNQNGPCPLIAIGNILLLRGVIHINSDYSMVQNSHLISLIAQHLLDSNQSKVHDNEETRVNMEKNINDAISLLPNMQHGLDVNLKFSHIKDFEYTPECIVFDLLDIDLVHGWLAAPEDKENYALLTSLSYNRMLEQLIAMSMVTQEPTTTTPSAPTEIPIETEAETPTETKAPTPTEIETPTETETSRETPPSATTSSITSSTASPVESVPNVEDPSVEKENVSPRLKESKRRASSIMHTKGVETYHQLNPIRREDITKENEEKIIREGKVVEKFLQDNATQLTYFGLYELHRNLKENQLCVFFRNNHFTTLFKYKSELYALITDSGFKHEPIVWEKLDEVDNNTVFYTQDFKEYEGKTGLYHALDDAVTAVSQTLSSLIPKGLTNALTGHRDNTETLLVGNMEPSEADIEQQLMIEEQIRINQEERDLELAKKLHAAEHEQQQAEKRTPPEWVQQQQARKTGKPQKPKPKPEEEGEDKKKKECTVQ